MASGLVVLLFWGRARRLVGRLIVAIIFIRSDLRCKVAVVSRPTRAPEREGVQCCYSSKEFLIAFVETI